MHLKKKLLPLFGAGIMMAAVGCGIDTGSVDQQLSGEDNLDAAADGAVDDGMADAGAADEPATDSTESAGDPAPEEAVEEVPAEDPPAEDPVAEGSEGTEGSEGECEAYGFMNDGDEYNIALRGAGCPTCGGGDIFMEFLGDNGSYASLAAQASFEGDFCFTEGLSGSAPTATGLWADGTNPDPIVVILEFDGDNTGNLDDNGTLILNIDGVEVINQQIAGGTLEPIGDDSQDLVQ